MIPFIHMVGRMELNSDDILTGFRPIPEKISHAFIDLDGKWLWAVFSTTTSCKVYGNEYIPGRAPSMPTTLSAFNRVQKYR